jgi:hypothetical protein
MYKKEFFIVEVKNGDALDDIAIGAMRESVVGGLEDGLRYISVISPDGVNRAEEAGHTTEDIEISEYLIILNDEDQIDIDKTADLVTEDFVRNGMIICMRNIYEEIKASNGSWIDKILEGDDG